MTALTGTVTPDRASLGLGNIQAWMKHGFDKGWCGEPTCIQHEGTPFTEIEAAAFDRGDDPCLVVVRINAHLAHD